MRCLICGNDDTRLMFKHNHKMLCRKCIMFQEGLKENELVSYRENLDAEYTLSFSLSEDQHFLSKALVSLVEEQEDVLIYAACGSGKTEIILETIKTNLEKGKVVGIAIPRRQVVIELSLRLKQYFTSLKVVCVCEGFTDVVYGDLIICTTHQLFRYENYFDLLILDEPDAFPFANNELLNNFLIRSCKGSLVYLTATPDDSLKQLKTLTLFKRYHGHDLLVPKVIINLKIILLYKMYQYVKQQEKAILFVPTIKLAIRLSKLFKTSCIHSKTLDKEDVIKRFNDDEFPILIATTIMERGVTFANVNICVLFADHVVFSKASLIQIAGRVGRTKEYPTGDGIFLCSRKSRKVDECISELNMMNA